MFAERQYWQDVADRFVKENVTVKPNRGNIISSDGKLMASSLPEYRIYMDFMSGEKALCLVFHQIAKGYFQIVFYHDIFFIDSLCLHTNFSHHLSVKQVYDTVGITGIML